MKIQIPDVFQEAFDPWPYKVFYGPRCGAKTESIGRILLVISTQKKGTILCCREIQNSIKDSVHKVLCDIINSDEEFSRIFKITDNEIVCLATGTNFIFRGLSRNITSIKSIKGIIACWVEEAHSVSQNSWDYLMPTIREDDSEMFITFNPDSEDDPVYKMFIKEGRDDALIKFVSWTDNPFFSEKSRVEMEHCKEYDIEKYNWIWLGQCRTVSDAQIFKGKFVVEPFETPGKIGEHGEIIEKQPDFMFGADWGFSQDPTVLIRCFVIDNTLYIDQERYGIGVPIRDLPELFDMPDIKKYMIYGDDSRPETIEHLKHAGFRIRGAKKGKGSIEDGIEQIRSYDRVVIHPRCKHTADEFKLYSYKINQHTGDIIRIPEDKHNHCFTEEAFISCRDCARSIKDVEPGDLVLTRYGYKEVIEVFDNGMKNVYDFRLPNGVVRCTPDHVIISDIDKEISSLTNLDYIHMEVNGWRVKTRNAKLSFWTVCFLTVILNLTEEQTGFISRTARRMAKTLGCTDIYGKSETARSQGGFVSTILTGIRSITASIISPVFLFLFMLEYTLSNITKKINRRSKIILTKSENWQACGTGQKMVENGTKNTQKTPFVKPNILDINVNTAEKNMYQRKRKPIDFVQTLVNRLGVEKVVLTMKIGCALFVGKLLQRISTRKIKRVHAGVRQVWDLEIKDQHEYYVNGVLVHNCVDALRYALRNVKNFAKVAMW